MNAHGEEAPVTVTSDFVRSYVITGGRGRSVGRSSAQARPSFETFVESILVSGLKRCSLYVRP